MIYIADRHEDVSAVNFIGLVQNMATDTQRKSSLNPFVNLGNKVAAANPQYKSELNPPENITPSTGTTVNTILILTPLSLVLIGLYFGWIDI